jgi:ADP-ribosylglycohydrolase
MRRRVKRPCGGFDVENALFAKVYGCLAGSQIGSALAGPVEHRTREEIRAAHGWVDRMLPHPLMGKVYPPGTTEDGVERQKLLILAIRDTGGPITIRDLARAWLKYIREESFGVLAGQQDEIHYRLIKAGVSPEDSGYHDAHVGRVGFHRACHPIGIVHACFPHLAAANALDVARIYQPPTGRGIPWKDADPATMRRMFPTYTIGIDWAAVVCAAVAEAMKPSATVESVVEQSVAYVVEPVREEILTAVDLAAQTTDYEELAALFDKRYCGQGQPFSISRAYEVVSKGIALFAFFRGDVRATMEGAANFGRDTDCLASISAGIAGAYSGVVGIPAAWIRQVDEAAKINGLTVMDLSIAEQARILYDALLVNRARLAAGVVALDALTGEETAP